MKCLKVKRSELNVSRRVIIILVANASHLKWKLLEAESVLINI